jgi:hypothetical protein
MRRSFILTLAAILFAAPTLAHADDASKHAKIEEMIRLTKMDDSITKLIEETKQEIGDVVNEQREGASALPPTQAKIMNDFETRISDLVVSSLKLEDIHPMMVKLYDETYTEAELDGILAFYKTPPGQALLNKAPDLVDKVMALVQQRVTALGPQVDKLTDDMQTQMEASRKASGPANPAPGNSGAAPDAAAPATPPAAAKP